MRIAAVGVDIVGRRIVLERGCGDSEAGSRRTDNRADRIHPRIRELFGPRHTLPQSRHRSGKRTGGGALVLYLHGGTSKGADNERPVQEPGVRAISSYLAAQRIAAVVIVPQCPKERSWGGAMNDVLKALIDEHILQGEADAERIYILGGSMGGTGTWSMLSACPGLFAAAMPVAGNPSGCRIKNVSGTPVLIVMGSSDRIMDIGLVSQFVEKLVESGGKAVLETQEGWTHEQTCTQSYTDASLNRVFGH